MQLADALHRAMSAECFARVAELKERLRTEVGFGVSDLSNICVP